MYDNDTDPSSKASPFLVDFGSITLEELAEYKMEKGRAKFENPDNYTAASMLMRYIRHIGEFLNSIEGLDYGAMMEYIADVQNVGSLLYPKLQEDMIQRDYEISMMEDEQNSKGPN
jgi:hypothetical protein